MLDRHNNTSFLLKFLFRCISVFDEKHRTQRAMERGNGGKSLLKPQRREKANATSSSRFDRKSKKRKCLQELFTADYIANNVFRNDGPPLGHEFDSLPSGVSFSRRFVTIVYITQY